MSELGENIKETTPTSRGAGNEVQKATSKLTGTDEDNDAASGRHLLRERENNDTDGGSRR